MTVPLALFFAASLLLVRFSWRPLHDRRSHGLYRFFAFEAITALVLLNAGSWFRDPFSPLQVLSWILLLVSVLLAAHGFYLLRMIGRPSGNIENTTRLIREGAFRYIRHPLYSSLLFFAWGAGLKDLTVPSIALALLATTALVATARVEERENREKFGRAYDAYVKDTRMFVPFVL